MALQDCDAPILVASNTDLIDRLSFLKPNLIRFSRFTYSGGAYAANPFTVPPESAAYGNQRKAIILPGNDADVRAELLDRDYGAATVGHNGGAYSISFYAYLRGGGTSGTFYAGFRDENGDPLTPTTWPADVDAAILDAADDVSFSVTATPTLFTWENVASDDPAFYADLPNNAQFRFFVSGASDIPSGSELVITEFQMQNGDYYAPHAIHLPWRPARGEEDLAQYTDYVIQTNWTELAAKTRQVTRSNMEGVGLVLDPNGPARVIRVPEDTFTLDANSDGTLVVTTGTDPATTQQIIVPNAASAAIQTRSQVQIRQEGDSPFEILPGPGVTINPPIGGSMLSIGKGSVMTLVKRSSSDIWDVTSSTAAAGGLTEIAFEHGEFDTVVPSGVLDSRRAPKAFTARGVRANVHTAQATGSILTFDVKVGGVSILSTLLTIDNTEETSVTAATPAVISTPQIADDAKITFECTQVGDGTAKGWRAWLTGYGTNTSVVGDIPVAGISLLCGFEGSDGSTTILDESTYNHTLTPTTAEIDTAVALEGSSSLWCKPGAVTTPQHASFDFGAGPFTVGCKIQPSDQTALALLAGYVVYGTKSSNQQPWCVRRFHAGETASGQPGVGVELFDGVTDFQLVADPYVLNDDQEYEILFDRDALGVVRLYIDGAMVASDTYAGNLLGPTHPLPLSGQTLRIGGYTSTFSWTFDGHIDEVTVIKGYALVGADAGYAVGDILPITRP